jgi:hypothetical protein
LYFSDNKVFWKSSFSHIPYAPEHFRGHAFGLSNQVCFLLLNNILQLITDRVVGVTSFCHDEIHEYDAVNNNNHYKNNPKDVDVSLVGLLSVSLLIVM